MKTLITLLSVSLFSLTVFADPSQTTVGDHHEEKPMGAIVPLTIPKHSKVFFKNLKNGAKIKKDTDFKVEFGVKGLGVKPAGDMTENSGHFHLVIDGLAIEKGSVVPFDDHHLHFGKGQTETTIKLPEGKHTLTVQFANGAHISYGSELSQTIEVISK